MDRIDDSQSRASDQSAGSQAEDQRGLGNNDPTQAAQEPLNLADSDRAPVMDSSEDVILFGRSSEAGLNGNQAEPEALDVEQAQLSLIDPQQISRLTNGTEIDLAQIEPLLQDIRLRVKRGERLEYSDFAARFPQYQEVLTRIFRMLSSEPTRKSSSPDGAAHEFTPTRPISEPVASQPKKKMEFVAPHIPQRLGEFELITEIGRGGMGHVFLARDNALRREVAVKVVRDVQLLDRTRLLRFQIEATAAANLQHPNIVQIHKYGQQDGVHFYAMQRISGRNLAELIDQMRRTPSTIQDFGFGEGVRSTRLDSAMNQPTISTGVDSSADQDLSIREQFPGNRTAASSAKSTTVTLPYCHAVARIGMQVASGLAYAHQCGVVHRDIKPSNLMLDSNKKVWITDFGLAHTKESGDLGLTREGEVMGTWRYMSPEQASGHSPTVDHRTDIYSLGATLYELLTLEPAIPGKREMEIRTFLSSKSPKSLHRHEKRIPEDLATIIEKAMSRNPDDRYVTATELEEDLNAFLHARPIQARRAPIIKRMLQWGQRHQRQAAAILGAMVIGAVLALGVAAGAVSFGFAAAEDRDQALAQVDQERAQRLQAQSRQYMAQAVGLIDQDPARALSLAADGLEAVDDPSARTMLVNAWLKNQREAILPKTGSGYPEAVWLAGDSKLSQTPSPQNADSAASLRITTSHLIQRDASRLTSYRLQERKLVSAAEVTVRGSRIAVASDGRTATAFALPQDIDGMAAQKSVVIFDLSSKQERVLSDAIPFPKTAAVYSPTSDRVVTLGPEGKLLVWRTVGGAKVSDIPLGEVNVLSACWSNDGNRLAAIDDQARIHLVNLNAPNNVQIIDLGYPGRREQNNSDFSDLSWSNDNQRLLVNTSTLGVQIIDLSQAEPRVVQIKRPIDRTWRTQFVPGTDLIVLWSPQRSNLFLYHQEDGAFVKELSIEGLIGKVEPSPVGGRLLVQRSAWTNGVQAPSPLILSVMEDREARELLSSAARWIGLTWSPDGERIASLDDQGELSLWQVEPKTETLRRRYQGLSVPGKTSLYVFDDQVAYTSSASSSIVSIDSEGRIRWIRGGLGAVSGDIQHLSENPEVPMIRVRRSDERRRGSDGVPAGVAELLPMTDATLIRQHLGAAQYMWGAWLPSGDTYLLLDQDMQMEARSRDSGTLVWRSVLNQALSGNGISPYRDAMLISLLDRQVKLIDFEGDSMVDVELDLPWSQSLRVTDVSWHPDGDRFAIVFDRRLVAVGSRSTQSARWAAQTKTQVNRLLISADGNSIAWKTSYSPYSVHFTSTESLFDEPANDAIQDRSEFNQLPEISFDGEGLPADEMNTLSGTNRFALIKFESGVVLAGLDQPPINVYEGKVVAANVSADGKRLALVESRATQVPNPTIFSQLETWVERHRQQAIIEFDLTAPQPTQASQIQWSGGVIRDISCGQSGWILSCDDFGMEVETWRDQQVVARGRVGNHAATVSSVAWLSNRRWATGSHDHSLQIWGADTLDPLGEPLVFGAAVQSMAASPDARWLLIGTLDQQVHLLDTEAVRLSPQSVPVGANPQQCLWNAQGPAVLLENGQWLELKSSGEVKRTLQLTEKVVRGAALSGDGKYLAWTETPEVAPMPPRVAELPIPVVYLVALDNPETATMYPLPAASLTEPELAWGIDAQGEGTLLAMANGTVFQLRGAGPQAQWQAIAALPRAHQLHTHREQLLVLAPDSLLLMNLTNLNEQFVVDGLLRGEGIDVLATQGQRIGYSATQDRWWLLEETGGAIAFPGSLVDQALIDGKLLGDKN